MAKTVPRAPVLFVGHGSPMNAIDHNDYTAAWAALGARLPVPRAILMVSAHWYVDGTRLCDAVRPRMIYDMYGFPDELYRVDYPAPGSPDLAREAAALVSRPTRLDSAWGLDHGAWSVLVHLFPRANVPVAQISVDRAAPAAEHFRLGQELAALRDSGVMIVGSGNVVHNLGRVAWDTAGGYAWADEFDGAVRDRVVARDFDALIDYGSLGDAARLAVPTPDHYFPLLYVLGAATREDRLTVFNDARVMGSLSMTGYLFE